MADTILGIPKQLFQFGILLLSGYPVSYFFTKIPKENIIQKHLYSVVTTGILCTMVLSFQGFVELFVLCLLIYFVTICCCKETWYPKCCFFILLGYMSIIHYQSQIANPIVEKDHSAMMMVLLIKLSSFAYCVYDGTCSEKGLDSYQKKYRITEIPPLTTFLGYCFFFNGVWAGPSFEFQDYKHFVHCQGHYSVIPSTKIHAMKCFLVAMFWILLELLFTPKFHYIHLPTTWFNQLHFLEKCIYLCVSGVVTRGKFYAVWKLSESTALVSGIGYTVDKDGKDAFDFAENVDILGYEGGCNVKVMAAAWNKFTANWLRRYVYVRTKNPNLKLAFTFFVSAIWHGFYPGYYLSFLSTIPFTECSRATRRLIRPLFYQGPWSRAYDIIGRCVSILCLNYFYTPFVLHSLKESLYFWNSMYFVGHLIAFGTLVMTRLLMNLQLANKGLN